MNQGFFKKTTLVFLSFAMIFSAFVQTGIQKVSAAEKNEILSGVDSRLLSNLVDVVEDDFNKATLDWTVKGASAEAVTDLRTPPYSVYEGSRSLLLKNDRYTEGEKISITKSQNKLSGLDNAKYFTITVWSSYDLESFDLSLSLGSREKNYSQTVSVEAGGWKTVFFDLAGSGLSGKATSVKLTLSSSVSGDIKFLIDLCGFINDENAIMGAKYLSSKYTPFGCSMLQTNNRISLSLSGNNQYVEADELYLTDFSGGAGIRIGLINNSSCRKIKLYYTALGSSEYSERLSVSCEIPEGNGEVFCTFPISGSYVGKFMIVFEGHSSGNVELVSVSPTPCYNQPSTIGEISECVIGRDKKSISIKGQINYSEASKFADCPIYLYEINPWEESSSVTTIVSKISETRLNGSSFSFSIPVSEEKNGLFKKYLVMAYYSEELVQVANHAFITNPEIFSEDKIDFNKNSIKGISSADSDLILDGASHTAVEIRLEKLVSLGNSEAVSHKVGDFTCTLDKEYINKLDELMKNYESCGINVNFVLKAGYTDDVSLSSLINHPSSSGGSLSAFNTTSSDGISVLRAVCDFLAKRYSRSSGVTSNAEGFVVGVGINNSFENYNMGKADLTQFTKVYSVALRTVYNSVKSVSSGVSVYMPISGEWYSAMPIDKLYAFDGKAVLEAVSSLISREGDIDWSVSYDVFEGNELLYWENPAPDISEAASRISISNFEVLTQFLKRQEHLYNGSERDVIILEASQKEAENENEYIMQSADFVCSYLKLLNMKFASVKAFIPSREVSYNNSFKYIDTNKAGETVEYVKELVGEEIFGSLSSPLTNSNRIISEKKAFSVMPSAVKGETVLFSFAENESGWLPLVNCASIKGNVSLAEKQGLLSARFSPSESGRYRGIDRRFSSTLDLSAAEYIGFEVQAAVLPDGVDSIEVSLVLWSGGSYSISSEVIKAGEWANFVAETSDFSKISSCDRMSILVRGVGGEDIGEPTLLIGNIRAMSETYSGEALEEAINSSDDADDKLTVSIYSVIAVSVVILILLGIEIKRIAKRRNREEI